MRKVALAFVIMGLAACGTANNNASTSTATDSDTNSRISAAFSAVKAGVEYPTDSQKPAALANKKILVLSNVEIPGDLRRIIVDSTASLSAPVAGKDYPTDSPIPASMVGKSVLVLGVHHRFLIDIQPAIAGIDFPTDGPSGMDRDFSVWAFSEFNRLPVTTMYAIEKAQAGIDYPTEMAQNFYVAITLGEDEMVRNRIP